MKQFYKKVEKRAILSIFIVLFSTISYARTYYVSTSGSNSNNGFTPEMAWKTISKINYSTTTGDIVKLKRGDIFIVSETETISQSGITITYYGTGNLPEIRGYGEIIGWTTSGNWSLYATGIYRMSYNYTYHRLWLDGIEVKECQTLTLTSDAPWRVSGGFIYVKTNLNPAIFFTSMLVGAPAGTTSTITMTSVSNVAIRGLKSTGGINAIKLINCKNITIDSCDIGYRTLQFGISITATTGDSSNNVIVKNSKFDTGDNLYYNYYRGFHSTSDGIWLGQGSTNCSVYNNVFLNWSHGAVQLINLNGDYPFNNNEIYNNFVTAPDIDYSRGFVVYYTSNGYNNSIHDNTILNTTIQNQLEGNNLKFYNNIIDNVSETPYPEKIGEANGIAIEGAEIAATNMEIYNNTITNCDYTGIRMYGTSADIIDKSHNYIHNNNIFNNGNGATYHYGYQMIVFAGPMFHDNKYENNHQYNSVAGNLVSYCGNSYSISGFNSIASTNNDLIAGNDAVLTYYVTGLGNFFTNVNDLRIENNATNTTKTVSLTFPMIDVKGIKYSSSIILQPYTSVILIKDNRISPILFNVNGGGSYCNGASGVPVGLSNSQSGVNYQLKLDGVNNGTAVLGSGTAISFGNKSVAGIYSVVATNVSTSAIANMIGSAIVTVNPLPVVTFLNGATPVIAGSTGNVYTTQSGMSNYQWTVSAGGTIASGGGTSTNSVSVTWNTAGTQNVSVNYTNSNGCPASSATNYPVTVNALPIVYNVTGGGSYCSGGSGISVGLSNSQSGVSYQLMLNGVNNGIAMAGTGIAINFGNKTVAGNYTVVATNVSTASTINMTGSATVIVNPIYSIIENITIKEGQVYNFWTQSGQYVRTLSSVSGCDSIVTTNLTVEKPVIKGGGIAPVHFITSWNEQTELNSMTIHVASAILEDLSLSADDEIAIYCGTSCVGAKKLTQSIDLADNSTFLSIPASQNDGLNNGFTPNDTILFKIWDNRNQKEMIAKAVTYRNDLPSWLTTGKYAPDASSTVEIMSYTEYTQTIQLKKGNNLFSTYINPTNPDVSDVMKSLVSQKALIKVQDETGNSFQNWGSYGGWINKIGVIKKTEGYSISVNFNCSFQVTGRLEDLPLDIPLQKGWNIISYPHTDLANAMSVIQSLIDQNRLVKVQDELGNSIENLKKYGGWRNNIGNFTPGKAYKVNVNNTASLTIQPNYTKSVVIPVEVENTEYFSTQVEGNGTNHMNINLIGLNESGISIGDELAAYDWDLCVGTLKITSDHFLKGTASLIASFSTTDQIQNGFKEGDIIQVIGWNKLTNKESKVLTEVVTGQMSYEKNASVLIQMKSLSTSIKSSKDLVSIHVFPNPSKGRITVRFSKLPDAGSRIDILDISGRKVASRIITGTFEEFNFDSQPAGIYLVKSILGTQEIIHKLIISK